MPSSALLTVLSLTGLLGSVRAAPSVNIAVRAAFPAPPLLVELLETAADENATAYFPLLDRIADGYFTTESTDRDLYTAFRELLQKEGHLGAEDLASFDYALSIRSAAPRVAAHYQFYNTSVQPVLGTDVEEEGCDSWLHVPFTGQRFCSAALDESTSQTYGTPTKESHSLPFDRILGDSKSDRPSILYADITSTSFGEFHKTLSKTAREGKTSYRVRYRPAASLSEDRPLAVSGYGVELALKRTDYIVIDDRDAEESEANIATKDMKAPSEATLLEEEVSDLQPLSQSELRRLGIKAASFVMFSDDPFDTLLRLSQDFPKHSSSIAAADIPPLLTKEHNYNRDILAPAGFNGLWINGVQMLPRDVDAYTLLDHLRHERKTINKVRELGLTGPEAIDLLAHPAITESRSSSDVPRYDWRDENEGGDVIIWMNDLAKDKRYADWPSSIMALLQRTYPGQLPSARRDVHNLVIAVDLADFGDVALVVESLQNFVKRKVPIRFGLVPVCKSVQSVEQAKIVYHLMSVYGLATTLDYLQRALVDVVPGKPVKASATFYSGAVEDKPTRKGKTASPFADVLRDDVLNSKIESSRAYSTRLGNADGSLVFANGVPITKANEWLNEMSQRLTLDNRIVQQAVYQGDVSEGDHLPDLFLASANLRRNALVVPEDDRTIRHLHVADLPQLAELPSIAASPDTIERELAHLTLVANLDSTEGFTQLMELLAFQQDHDNVELALLHVPEPGQTKTVISSLVKAAGELDAIHALLAKAQALVPSTEELTLDRLKYEQRIKIYEELFSSEIAQAVEQAEATTAGDHVSLISELGLHPKEYALILNGRVVGPIPTNTTLERNDLEALFTYERKKRLLPAALAVQKLGLQEKAATPAAFAIISNIIALSTISDIPEGMFEAASTIRTSVFKHWQSEHTAIKVGEIATASIQIFASIDPASELAQRWIPIIKALSELDGVYTCLFLNPRDRLEEIPVKRFYRYVINSKPSFEEDGSLSGLSAKFSGLPADALLNAGMNVPPGWLVAPKETVHDLDNIKLSAVKSGSDIEAVYELEHILIEGHCRDATLTPPRGVQLVLGTEADPAVADTIVMANLGYFQFKANPGVYNLALRPGRSEELFHIDSAGTQGYNPQPGDDTTDIALMSFKGSSIYPRLSRVPGKEDEDVLEASKSTFESLTDNADKFLAQAGIKMPSAFAKLGQNVFGNRGKDVATARHADINIFSVASGHLYERMLNIMMLSVMKHTSHTVKFWFIEQFLSPSFKDFLPVMAQEYGFQYEMVTYKWPHWLRGQKEKQREIWGYKILFLDVLFPLDLDKVIFVDADQIVRTDMYELVQHDLQGAPYGFTPMCDSRVEMEGFRFWKQGYWKNFLKGLPYHISALYVVDLKEFRRIAAGDRLRQNYHALSADPGSLSNLDQDLPNHMQSMLPIHSLPQEWLWCETWCSDESLKDAKTIDLCNNPQTKEPKLDRARRQVPEWTIYDDEIAAVAKRRKQNSSVVTPGAAEDGESIQEQLQREDAEREKKQAGHIRDEL